MNGILCTIIINNNKIEFGSKHYSSRSNNFIPISRVKDVRYQQYGLNYLFGKSNIYIFLLKECFLIKEYIS